VKRLLPYVILALAFHAIIFSTDFSWLKFASSPMPASRSLSITLSADNFQKRKTQTAVTNKGPEKQFESSLNQKLRKNPVGMPVPALVEHTVQLQKPLPATPPKNIVTKALQKKNLKALTRKRQTTKTGEAARTTLIDKRRVPLKVQAKIFSLLDSGNKSNPHQFAGDTALIKKTQSVPDGSSEPTTTAAIQPAIENDGDLSGSVLQIARPLYKQNTSPPYPRKARRMGYEGIVMLKVLVDENGRVDNLMLLKSSGYTVLDGAALSAVKKWLFEPGTEGGIKKKMWVKIPVRFDLK